MFREHLPAAVAPEVLSQSVAIIDWLEAFQPDPILIPRDPDARADVLAMALVIACDIHPLNNLRVLKYLAGPLSQPEPVRDAWYRHWISEGLAALERLAAANQGPFLHGESPTFADICLVPQLYNARRFDVALDDFPSLLRADAEANRLEAFAAAHPDRVVGSS